MTEMASQLGHCGCALSAIESMQMTQSAFALVPSCRHALDISNWRKPRKGEDSPPVAVAVSRANRMASASSDGHKEDHLNINKRQTSTVGNEKGGLVSAETRRPKPSLPPSSPSSSPWQSSRSLDN
ncbi:hypothetical protein TYRP_004361 [Tyrophagus putrescentiae]|nr:hypothetical protein TYRP_004361 [Tyrophagus putrescentiae]